MNASWQGLKEARKRFVCIPKNDDRKEMRTLRDWSKRSEMGAWWDDRAGLTRFKSPDGSSLRFVSRWSCGERQKSATGNGRLRNHPTILFRSSFFFLPYKRCTVPLRAFNCEMTRYKRSDVLVDYVIPAQVARSLAVKIEVVLRT